MDVINDLSMLHGGALEILPIMPALCSMLFNAYYAQNYAGIIGASLVSGADKQKNCSLFDKSTKIGIHVILIELK